MRPDDIVLIEIEPRAEALSVGKLQQLALNIQSEGQVAEVKRPPLEAADAQEALKQKGPA